jgi:hypothetical protein
MGAADMFLAQLPIGQVVGRRWRRSHAQPDSLGAEKKGQHFRTFSHCCITALINLCSTVEGFLLNKNGGNRVSNVICILYYTNWYIKYPKKQVSPLNGKVHVGLREKTGANDALG